MPASISRRIENSCAAWGRNPLIATLLLAFVLAPGTAFAQGDDQSESRNDSSSAVPQVQRVYDPPYMTPEQRDALRKGPFGMALRRRPEPKTDAQVDALAAQDQMDVTRYFL